VEGYKCFWSFRSRGTMCEDSTFFEFLSACSSTYLPYKIIPLKHRRSPNILWQRQAIWQVHQHPFKECLLHIIHPFQKPICLSTLQGTIELTHISLPKKPYRKYTQTINNCNWTKSIPFVVYMLNVMQRCYWILGNLEELMMGPI